MGNQDAEVVDQDTDDPQEALTRELQLLKEGLGRLGAVESC